MTPLIITVVVLVLIALWAAGTYNALIATRNQVDEAGSDIHVQMRRRYDLIPNLVETVKGYAKHEDDLFTKVTEARAGAISANGGGINAEQQAEKTLSGALRTVFAVAENYPELKANEN